MREMRQNFKKKPNNLLIKSVFLSKMKKNFNQFFSSDLCHTIYAKTFVYYCLKNCDFKCIELNNYLTMKANENCCSMCRCTNPLKTVVTCGDVLSQ